MSIASNNSFDEECFEIIEGSVKSCSDEEFSCDDEDECLARELLHKLNPAVLSKFRRCFNKGRDKRAGSDLDSRVQEVMRQAAAVEGIEFPASQQGDEQVLWIHEDGFVRSLDDIFGHHKYTTHAHKLFHLLDPFSTGRVRWRALVDRLVEAGARRTGTRADVWRPVKEKRIQKLEHCKRETIIKLVSIPRSDSFCYAAVSKGGRVGVYSGGMQLMHSYEVFYQRTGVQRRVKNSWVTDCLYLDDVQSLVISASDRSLTVYDAATLSHTPVYCITGLPNIITCMAYTAHANSSSELALGTERGDVTRIRFLQPRVALFYTKSSEHINYYFWMELTSPPHTSYCHISTWRRMHARSVRRVSYFKGGKFIITCSHDSNVSVRMKHVMGKMDDYTFKVQRGVTCFHAIPSLHLLATGSPDGIVRLWETTQSSPFACLRPAGGGGAAVLDVAVVASREIVIGYCSNCWLHIWHLHEECLLQTIKIKFPFLGVLGKKVEFGAFCIHPGPLQKQTSSDSSSVSSPDLETASRRSSVYQGSTGGLILQGDGSKNDNERPGDSEYNRFATSDLLITCCDFVCTVELDQNQCDVTVLPPPADTLTAKRPSFWDLPEDVFKAPSISPPPHPCPLPLTDPYLQTPATPTSKLLSPATAEFPRDLDTLLKNAGLQGILEKDFVLMRGLKHDLNKKLLDMKAGYMNTMSSAVDMGAPHLGLRCCEVEPVTPGDEMRERYHRVMRPPIPKEPILAELAVEFEYLKDRGPNGTTRQNRLHYVSVCKNFDILQRGKCSLASLSFKVGKDMVSLAEGMPNEDVFPYSKIRLELKSGAIVELEGQELRTALQYLPSQGLPSLLSSLRSFQHLLHRPPPLKHMKRDVIATSGAQHAIYMCCEMFVAPGDPVLIAEYAFTGVQIALKPYDPEILSIPEDAQGIRPDIMESVLAFRKAQGLKMPKILYTNPIGNNPSGTVLPEDRKRQIYELACKYDFLILEDDPYMFLKYDDTPSPSFLSMDWCGRVVRVDSLSKVVSSGLRAGWVTAPAPVLHRMELHIQAQLLHSCSLGQTILHNMLSDLPALKAHLTWVRSMYRARRDALHRALQAANLAEWAEWNQPSGGIFLWMKVKGVDDVYNMAFQTALQRGLMLIPGHPFQYDSSAPSQYIRLTFSKVPLDKLEWVARRLSALLQDERGRVVGKRVRSFATE